MAIKIIKQGVKEFHITCPYCGCEFTYENEDVCNSEVICPCCSTNLPHKGVIGKVDEAPLPTNGEYGTITNPHGTYPMPIWYNQQVAPDGYKTHTTIWFIALSRFPVGQQNLIIGAVAKVVRTIRSISKHHTLGIVRVNGVRKIRGK